MRLRCAGRSARDSAGGPALDEADGDCSSAPPRRVANPGAGVRLAEAGIAIFDVIEIDGPERGLRLLQRRAGLDLDEFVLEIAARKCRNHLVALLRRVVV